MKAFLSTLKTFLSTLKGKIIFGAVALLVLVGAVAGGYGLWSYLVPKFQDLNLELGSPAVTVEDFLTKHGKAEKAAFAVDFTMPTKTGTYPVTLIHGSREETVNLILEDSAAPTVTFRDVHSPLNSRPVPEDFIENAEDLSGWTASFLIAPADGLEDSTVTVAVSDPFGNTTTGQCDLTYRWLKPEYNLELGQQLTRQDLLYFSESIHLVSQEDVDAINASGMGEYTVESTYEGITWSCKVTVADTVGPVLTVQGVKAYSFETVKPEAFVTESADMTGVKELRFEADPDMTLEGEQTLVIEAEDTLGNISRTEVTLTVMMDKDAPWFVGIKDLIIPVGITPSWTEGVWAKDTVDGFIHYSFDPSSVNLNVGGTYIMRYKAEDRSGNVTYARRKVIVQQSEQDRQELIAEMAAKAGDDLESIRQFVRNTIGYSTNWGGDDPVWYGFKTLSGNCYVHAMCLNAILEAKGYKTWLVGCKDKSHYWSIVEVEEGVYRHIDATPDAPHHNKYELMTDEQRMETLMSVPNNGYDARNWDRSAVPECK